MKGFLRKVLLIASIGATLAFYGCTKDFTQDIEDVRKDLIAALEQQNAALTASINQAKQDAQKYADEAAQAAKDYADKVADAAAKKAEAAQAAADAAQATADDAKSKAEAAQTAANEAKKAAENALTAAKEYADKVAAEKALEAYNKAMADVKPLLEQTLTDAKSYTDEQIKALKSELEKKITDLETKIQGAIDGLKATVDALDGRVEGLEDSVEALTSKVDAVKTELMTYIDGKVNQLKAADEALNVRLTALEAFQAEMKSWQETVNADLENLKKGIEDLQGQLSTLADELKKADAKLAEDIAKVAADLKSFQESMAAEIQGLKDMIAELQGICNELKSLILENKAKIAALEAEVKSNYDELKADVAAINETLAEHEAALEAAKQYLEGKIDDLGEALRAEMAEADKALQDQIDILDKSLEDLKTEFNGKIDEVYSEIDKRAKELEDKINTEVERLDGRINDVLSALGRLEDAVKNRITSISLIPEMYIGGVESINIPSIAYIPKSVSDKEIPSALNQATNILPWYEPVKVRYHVSPSNVNVDCIGAAEYLTEYAKFVKSAGEEAFLNVDLGASKVNSKNELEVAVKRAHAESMLPFTLSDYKNTELAVWPTVALSLSIAEDYRVDGVEANVTSEYVLFTEDPHILHITKNADPCDIVDGCTTYYTDYASACAGTDFIPVVFDSTLDLSTLVSTHIAGTEVILNRDQIKGIGLDYRFVIPTLENLADDGTDQQKFIRFADESNEVVASFVPGGHENSPASIGRTPVVRVELYDVNTNQVVDVKWIKIKWVRESIPAQDFGLIKSFEQILDCSNLFEFRIDWETINDKILAAGLEISHEQFVDLYGTAKVSVDAENTTINPATSARAYFVKNTSPVQPQTSVYRITVGYKGLAGIIDEILKDGKASRTVTVRVVPSTVGDTQVGEIKFSVNIDWTLPAELLPSINGYKLTNSWTVAEQLAMVEPIGFSDKNNTQPGKKQFVRYYFNMKGLFNLDTKSGFVANLVPEQEGLDFSCRTWDMQFSSETEGYSENTNLFRPTFFTNPAILYAKDNSVNGYQLINKSNRKVAATFAYNPENQNWYNNDEKVSSIYFSVAKYADNDQVTKLLNPVNVEDNARVKLPVNVWSMLTPAFTNVYKVKTFDMWVVSPVQMPELKQQNLSLADINMNVSQVILPTGTALLSGDIKDFQGNKIDTDDKKAYYGVKVPTWQIDNSTAKYEILTDIIIDENNNITVNPELNPNNYASAAEAKRNMRNLSKAGFDATFEGTTLKVTNKQGSALTQTVTFWIPVAYEHAYQKYFAYIPVTYKPNSETPAN